LAYLYYSRDNGETWETSDFLIEQGTNKHVHLVKYSKTLNRLFVADGDNYKRLWVSDPLNGSARNANWHSVTKIHTQMGGYTSVVEDGETILFGTDYQGGTNFLVMTGDGKKYVKKVVPDPYRRSPIDNMVVRRSKTGTEIWANLPYSTANTKCLLMYSADGGANWTRVVEYNKATHKAWLLSTSAEIVDELYLSIESTKTPDRVVYKITD
jgi:Tol biopolymer transport system component